MALRNGARGTPAAGATRSRPAGRTGGGRTAAPAARAADARTTAAAPRRAPPAQPSRARKDHAETDRKQTDRADPGASAPFTLPPERLLELQREYLDRAGALWNGFVAEPQSFAAPLADRRFADAAWQQDPLASFQARAYLLNAEFLQRLAAEVQADDWLRRRLRFAVEQWVDAAAPSNFLAFNPQAQRRLIETGGASLAAGLRNLCADLARGRISHSDATAFDVGRNLATTPGAVIHENALCQLIQYAPVTPTVHARPLVIVPPCINKFYVLDLQPDSSLVRHALTQGRQVFMLSWKNAGAAEASFGWDDYLELGPLTALRVAQAVTRSDAADTLGFCVGGTLLATALAVRAARGEAPAASLTLMATPLDFADAGVLGLLVDEAQVVAREKTIGARGLMRGWELAQTFASLRANELVWNYVVGNYLEGRMPAAFDLLHWNGDVTNLPGPMFTWYLRHTYLENRLVRPRSLRCCGVPVDLRRLRLPTYVFAAADDHIVPWRAAYASAQALPGAGGRGGAPRFVLGASGHIAGSINPAARNRRSYEVRDAVGADRPLPAAADAWRAQAQQRPGSWWHDWTQWLAALGGPQRRAPQRLGDARHRPIEPAPGRYVKEQA